MLKQPSLACLACAVLWAVVLAAQAEDFDSAGVKIHYVVEGSGEPVILIHGLYSSAQMNWGMPGTMAQLAKHFRVIALDNRGHGASDKPSAEGEYGEKMVEDVVRLMDHLGIKQAHIVGYSMGGMIAMKLVVNHPDRVRSAVLGGMGWLKDGSALQEFWKRAGRRSMMEVPPACLHGFADLAVSAAEVKAVKVPVTMIVGDRDPCKLLYVDPMRGIRPDWPVHEIKGSGHLNCIVEKEFKDQLEATLASGDHATR